MLTNIYKCIVIMVVLLVVSSTTVWGQGRYTAGELDELFGPIALYPDPLLAQILPASTYLDQLNEAARFREGPSAIDSQPWDVSVKAVAHYPEVLDMMVKNPDWTISIGQAYVNQPGDVLNSIQRLREKAELMGYLSSNAQQQVATENGLITIVPAQPQYIYVPQYNPQVVYVEPAPQYGTSPWITFGAGLLIGAWLNNNINWYNHSIYYHGWHGGGWISHSRSYVDWHNRHYVNNNWNNRPVPVDRNINRHNTQAYRSQIQRNVGTYKPPMRPGTYPEPGRRPNVPSTRPSQPSTRPSVPGTRPGYPGTRPGQPTTRPSQPTTRPSQPSARPTHPTTRPGQPSVRPSSPPTRPSGGYRPSGSGGGGHRGGGHRGGGGGRRGR